MKFYLWQIIIQNDFGIVAGMIAKIPILPKPVPMKHGHWNEWFFWRETRKAATFSTPCENIEMKCTWTLTSMIWSMDFITSACKRPCPKWYSLNRMNEWPKFPSKNKNLEKTYCALIMPPGKQKLTMTHSSGWRDWLDLTNGMFAPTAKLMITWKMERTARVAKKINKTQNRRGDWVVWF